jgi:uridine kinase
MAVGEHLDRAGLLVRLARLLYSVDVAHPLRVAIDGPDAAGKTTLADELAVVLRDDRDREVIRASIDGFHRPRVERYRQGRDSPAGYYEDTFDYTALRTSLLDPFGPDGSREYLTAAFDFRTDKPLVEPLARASERSILLVDGVFLLRPNLQEAWDFTIFISVSFEETLRRATTRDLDLFGTADEVERRYRTRYIPGQELYFARARPDETADAVVLNDDVAAPMLVVREPRTRLM